MLESRESQLHPPIGQAALSARSPAKSSRSASFGERGMRLFSSTVGNLPVFVARPDERQNQGNDKNVSLLSRKRLNGLPGSLQRKT